MLLRYSDLRNGDEWIAETDLLAMGMKALRTPRDVARRTALRQLQPPRESSPSPYFRVRAWRWHHLGVIRDLRRLETSVIAQRGKLCPAKRGAAERRQVVDALQYIIHDNWDLHNTVETSLFVPWLHGAPGVKGDGKFRRAAHLVAAERQAMRYDAEYVLAAAERWVQMDSEGCERGLRGIEDGVRRLRENAAVLFGAAEAVFIPRVVQAYSEKEQLKFNDAVLRKISGKQARISLVIFGDAVRQDAPVVGTARDRKDFEKDIPAPIRKLALPYWRRKFVSHKIRFLIGTDGESREQ